MLVSKKLVKDFQEFIGHLKQNYPVNKDGTCRSNLSKTNIIAIEDTYFQFITNLVQNNIRKLEPTETVDVTKIYIPDSLNAELDRILGSVEPMLVFWGVVALSNYKDCEETDVVIIDDNVIILKERK